MLSLEKVVKRAVARRGVAGKGRKYLTSIKDGAEKACKEG